MAATDRDSFVELDHEELDAEFMASVAERYSQNVFPLIRKEEQDVVSMSDAEELFCLSCSASSCLVYAFQLRAAAGKMMGEVRFR